MNQREVKKNQKVKLTIEKLREFEGFETISDEEAEDIIWSLRKISEIYFDCFQKRLLKKC